MSGSIPRRALTIAAAVFVLAGLGSAAVFAVSLARQVHPSKTPAASVKLATAASAHPAPAPTPSWFATLGHSVAYSNSPGGAQAGTVPATNPFGEPTVVAVVGSPLPDGWMKVELPIRPDGSLGWIPTSQVTLGQTWFAVHVNRADRTLTVTDHGKAIITTPVAVGKPSTPTPSGDTYLWESIQTGEPDGAYGPFIFGLALFSNAYSIFNGGDAQIGIHGQDEPSSIGYAVSHGCIRLPNSVISTLAGLLPLGTPVTIT